MIIPEAITIGGKTGTVVYLNDKWHPVSVEQATMARVLFDDGSTGFFMAESIVEKREYVRDEDGRFAEVYHGTIERKLDNILKEGLTLEHAGEIWSGMSHKDSVYITTSEKAAIVWADATSQRLKDMGIGYKAPPTAAILKIRIPLDQEDKLTIDVNIEEDPDKAQAWQFKGNIPPQWIVGAKVRRVPHPDVVVSSVPWVDVPLKKAAADGRIIYVVLILDELQSVAKYDPSQPRDPQGTPTGGQFTETGRAGRPESGTYLVSASRQGIPEIEKLLPEAIKTARYENVLIDWEDLNEATREKVFKKFVEEHYQLAHDDVYTGDLDADVLMELRNDPVRQAKLTKETEHQFRIYERHRIAEDSISTDLTQLKHLDGTDLTLDEKADAALLWRNLYEEQERYALYEIRGSDDYEKRREALIMTALEQQWKGTSKWDKMHLATNMRIMGELPGVTSEQREPLKWVTGVEKGTHADNNYALTHAIAQRLTELRFDELREERDLKPRLPEFTIEVDKYDPNKFEVVNEDGYTVMWADSKEEALEKAAAWQVTEQANQTKSSTTIIEDTWNQWKRSSSEGLSLSMQLAAAEELGGNHRLTRGEVQEALSAANDEIDGIETMKAYVRAQWEVTQFVMKKSGEDTISVYRGLMLAGERVRNTTKQIVDKFGRPLDPPKNIRTIEERVAPELDTPEKPPLRTMVAFDFNGEHFVVEKEQRDVKDIRDLEPPDSGRSLEDDATAIQRRIDIYMREKQFVDEVFTQLPDIALRRAGAQSTTGTRGIANDWGGVGDLPENPIRVVLRIEAPATSILSLPVYGQNSQAEHETVLLGTTDKWLWDAWRNKAPDFASHRVGQARKSEPLLLDLQAEDRGQPHWLTNSDTLEGEHGITHKWNEAQHPRDEDGKFTVSGVRHDSVQTPQPHAGAGGSGGVAVPKATRPDAVQAAHDVANAYNALHDRGAVTHDYVTVDEGGARSIAKAYEALPDDDSANPAVKEAYDALATEIQAQWDYLKAEGYTLLPWTSGAQPGSSVQAPYATSSEMAADVRDNKRLYFFTGGNPHPYIGDSTKDADGLTINDKFRAIHDVFGHAAGGYGFGARGEENAWRAHSQMFSAKARRAMTTETRGQNSWVNFGVQNYNADGTYKNVPPAERPYAKQKVALLPDRYVFP